MRDRNAGFTLIELLVVIAIIAILAAILFPIFVSAKNTSKQTTCANNVRELTHALILYANDWSGALPGLNAFGMLVDPTTGPANKGPLTKYLGSKKIQVCPVDMDGRKQRFTFSYSINGSMTPIVDGMERGDADTTGARLDAPRRASKTILLVDENTDPSRAEYGVNDALFIWYDRSGDRHPYRKIQSYVLNGKVYKTKGGAVVSYADGHTGMVPGMIQWQSDEGQELFKRY